MTPSLDQRIESLLRNCTVGVEAGDGGGRGTGFFIRPSVVVTCKHCIRANGGLAQDINVIVNGTKLSATVSSLREDLDLVLLDITLPVGQTAFLDPEIVPGDTCLGFGYSEEFPNGEPFTVESEGAYFNEHGHHCIKTKGGEIVVGLSGSPLLNTRTGAVVAIVAWSRLSPLPDWGANAISVSELGGLDSELLASNYEQHTKDPTWRRAARKYSGGIFSRDKTLLSPAHFSLYPHDPKRCSDIYIRPACTRYILHDLIEDSAEVDDLFSDLSERLVRQRIVFLMGPYGCGKTIASKVYQEWLIEKGHDTVFFSCPEIADDLKARTLLEEFQNRKISGKNLFVFFDSNDEIHFLREERIDIYTSFTKRLFEIVQIDGIYVIVNSRLIYGRAKEMTNEIALQTCAELRLTEAAVYQLDYFDRGRVDEWLDSYSCEMGKEGREERLYHKDIKQVGKRVSEACKNPLFLYMIVSHYYDGPAITVNDIYNVYQSFVTKTIRGKFSYENPVGSGALEGIASNYRLFLRALAKLVARQKELRADEPADYGWYLDVNKDSYWIDSRMAERLVLEIAPHLLRPGSFDGFDKDRLVSNVLGCYFLEWTNTQWRMRDNNILHFLIAEALFDMLDVLRHQHDGRTPFRENYRRFVQEFDLNLHPLSLEFFFMKVDSLPDEEKANLALLLKEYIEKGYALQINRQSMAELGTNKLNSDLLVGLIFLHLNRGDYGNIGYYFKRLNWYTSAAKLLSRTYLHLVRRFFRRANIVNSELRRINFDGYNFDMCVWQDIRFIQCKMHGARMNQVTALGVEFYLSDIKDVNMDGVSGDMLFRNCVIDKVYCTMPREARLVFKRCHIKRLEFHGRGSDDGPVDISFEGCDIDNFVFRDCVGRKILLKQTQFAPLKLEGSRVTIELDRAVKRGRNVYDGDMKSRVELMSSSGIESS